jgi:hypothetical protein
MEKKATDPLKKESSHEPSEKQTNEPSLVMESNWKL